MGIELITILLFLCMFILMGLGAPISFALIVTGIMFGITLWGPSHLFMVATSLFGATKPQVLMAIPMFVFMGYILTYTGIAKRMFDTFYKWSGPVNGGLAMGTILICAIFAAMCGSSAAATITMGTIALPSMREHNYNKILAIGTVAAGGLLGFLIPPSMLAIIYASIAGISIGRLYLAMFGPGILLASLYIIYIGIRAQLLPGWAPSISKELRPSLREKFVSLKGVIAPILIVFFVLGGIYSGAVTPTEAAAVGAFCVFVAAAIEGVLTWDNIKRSVWDTLRITSMVMWLIMAVTLFTNVYNAIGARDMIIETLGILHVGGFAVILLMQLTIFILGCVMDDVAVIMLCTPIYLPIVTALGYDPIWFGVLFMVNMQCAWLTPPYGFNLFYMRAITDPKDIDMLEIYRSVIPFICIQMICLLLVMFYKPISMWLPSVVFGT